MQLDLNLKQEKCTKMFVDNQVAIAISNNPVFHANFNIKLFFLRDVQKEGSIGLKYCKTHLQLTDMFTEALPKSRFEFLKESLGICSN